MAPQEERGEGDGHEAHDDGQDRHHGRDDARRRLIFHRRQQGRQAGRTEGRHLQDDHRSNDHEDPKFEGNRAHRVGASLISRRLDTREHLRGGEVRIGGLRG